MGKGGVPLKVRRGGQRERGSPYWSEDLWSPEWGAPPFDSLHVALGP